MAEIKTRKPASQAQTQAIAQAELSWFTNKNGTWCAETDLGWCVADGKLDEQQVADAVEDGDITFTVDPETGVRTFFVGYNTSRRSFSMTVKKFAAKESAPIDRHVAVVSKVYQELE